MLYEAVVRYEGAISYEIEAESEDEAREIAEQMFECEPPEALSDNFCDSGVDVWKL